MSPIDYQLTGCPVPLVCPRCKAGLAKKSAHLQCVECGQEYPFRDGLPDLIVGDRYDDDTPECAVRNEESTNRETTERFWIPLFKKEFPNVADLTILSLGCGVGADVDSLSAAGFKAVGIDNGKRSAQWLARRRYPQRLISGNGKRMPFPDGAFDAIFCGCVFPHVGVEGTTFNTTPDFHEQRLELARDMARVLKPGGKIFSCNPNRFFPFDIFHGHQAGRPVLRLTMPWDPLLLSVADYRRMFSASCSVTVSPLPVENYWNFTNSRKTLKGRILSAPIRALFRVVSRIKPLRGSPLNPWLIVRIEKQYRPAEGMGAMV